MGYSTGTLNTSQILLGALPGLENLTSLSTWRASLCQLGVFETDPGEGCGRHARHYSKSLSPAQVVGRDLLTRRCRWIFGGYRLLQQGRSARPGGGGLHDKRIRFPKR